MADSKAVLLQVSGVNNVTDPLTNNLVAQIQLDMGLASNGSGFSLTPVITVAPEDTSAAIRQKMIDAAIALALADFNIVLAKEDIILPTYTTGLSSPASESRTDTFTVPANGQTVDTSLRPLTAFSITVEGVGGAPTSWDVRLEGSLDGTNFTQILQHTQVSGRGQTVFSGSNRSPALFFRSRCAGLVLGVAAAIDVDILGVP